MDIKALKKEWFFIISLPNSIIYFGKLVQRQKKTLLKDESFSKKKWHPGEILPANRPLYCFIACNFSSQVVWELVPFVEMWREKAAWSREMVASISPFSRRLCSRKELTCFIRSSCSPLNPACILYIYISLMPTYQSIQFQFPRKRIFSVFTLSHH